MSRHDDVNVTSRHLRSKLDPDLSGLTNTNIDASRVSTRETPRHSNYGSNILRPKAIDENPYD